MPFLTIAGENKLAQNQSVNGGLNIVSFVLANVPNLGVEPADRIAALPDPSLIVDTLPFTKRGYVNPNQVVYSLVMGSNIGDYDFNWIGLVDADGVLVAVSYIPTIQKRKNVGGIPGNTITRNFLLKYTGIQEITATTVPVETWQIDFGNRLNGIDERERLANLDIYDHEGFLDDGWKVTGSAGTYSVAAGIGYVGGVRAKNTAPQEITTNTFPNEIWLNVSLQGDISDMTAVCEFVIDTGPFADYVDGNGIAHYLTKIANIDAAGEVDDGRKIYSNAEESASVALAAAKYYSEDAGNLNRGEVSTELLQTTDELNGSEVGKLLKATNSSYSKVFSVSLPENVCRRYMTVELPSVALSALIKVSVIEYQPQKIASGSFEAVYSLIRNDAASVSTLSAYASNAVVLVEPEVLDSSTIAFGLTRTNNGTSTTGTFYVRVEVLSRNRAVLINPSDGSITHAAVGSPLLRNDLGMVANFPSLVAPHGFLKLTGGEVSRNVYSRLYVFAQQSGNLSASEATKEPGQFGPGDGVNTFTLPDVQGMTIRTLDESGSIDVGRLIGSYQDDAMQNITGRFSVQRSIVDGFDGVFSGGPNASTGNDSGGGDTGRTVIFDASTVVRTSTEQRVKNVAWPAYIKY